MIRSIQLLNKPLYILEHNNEAFIGDARGRVLKLSRSFLVPEPIAEAAGPVSTIFFADNKMFYGSWDGILYSEKREKKLGSAPIKCGCFFNNKIFISIDSKLLVLTKDFEILDRIEAGSKVFDMNIYQNKLNCAMANGSVYTYSDRFEQGAPSDHEMSILCIKDGLTGSTDCTVRKEGKLVFQGKGWIRSIWDSNLFSCGVNVVSNNQFIYSHSDEVVGIIKIQDTIISIGLDYCYKIFQDGVILTAEEENELLELLM